MGDKGKKLYVHKKWLTRYTQDSSDPLVQESEQWIQNFTELVGGLPNKFGRRHLTSKVVHAEIKSSKSPSDLNRLYWHDVGYEIEAYGITVCFRAAALMKPALYSLNRHEIIASAVLVRSLLEIAAIFVFISNNIELNIIRALKEISKRGRTDFLYFDEKFDELLRTATYGTRWEELISSAPKSYNIMDMLRKASKISDSKELLPTYEFLCELAHPNIIGNICFWGENETNIDGTETTIIGRKVIPQFYPEIIEKILRALSWSCFCIPVGYNNILETRKKIMERFPPTLIR